MFLDFNIIKISLCIFLIRSNVDSWAKFFLFRGCLLHANRSRLGLKGFVFSYRLICLFRTYQNLYLYNYNLQQADTDCTGWQDDMQMTDRYDCRHEMVVEPHPECPPTFKGIISK